MGRRFPPPLFSLSPRRLEGKRPQTAAGFSMITTFVFIFSVPYLACTDEGRRLSKAEQQVPN